MKIDHEACCPREGSIKTFFNWSSGKDSALALYSLLRDRQYNVATLLTTVNEHYGRVSIHGLRQELLQAQAQAIGLPLQTISLPHEVTNEVYSRLMKEQVMALCRLGYTHAAFGDIFLEDLRAYREAQLAAEGIKAIFPLWGRNTHDMARQFIAAGFKAIVVSVDAAKLDAAMAGRNFDELFLSDLPAEADPCGEYGEFHTFCYDGPLFRYPVPFDKGETVYREYPLNDGQAAGFWYCDLLPRSEL